MGRAGVNLEGATRRGEVHERQSRVRLFREGVRGLDQPAEQDLGQPGLDLGDLGVPGEVVGLVGVGDAVVSDNGGSAEEIPPRLGSDPGRGPKVIPMATTRRPAGARRPAPGPPAGRRGHVRVLRPRRHDLPCPHYLPDVLPTLLEITGVSYPGHLPREHAGEWELYDITADPAEPRDLAAENPALVREFADAWEAWAARCGVLPFDG